jgi:formate C-acetyltransferase
MPDTLADWDALWAAYVAQIEHLSELNMLAAELAGEGQKRRGHCPLMSSLLDGCLARRRDLVDGGTRYNLSGIAIYGPTNVYDGLMAIRRCVFQEHRLTMAQLHQALLADYQGHETLRQMLAHQPQRFGNDVSDVDALANRVNAVHADYCGRREDARGGRYICGVWPVEGHVHAGHKTWATPDGRHAGAPLVDGVGACQGADRNGPTALLRSVAKLNNIEHWPAGNTCNVKFSPGSIGSARGVAHMRDLASTFMQLKGQELQINVIDAETLRAAQRDPDAHADLIVRVAGFSAYFTQLGRDTQQEIISRTEHTV